MKSLTGGEIIPYCPECGEEVERGLKFCPDCGAEITSSGSSSNQSPSPATGVTTDTAVSTLEIIIAILILTASIFALMGGNNVRSLQSEMEEEYTGTDYSPQESTKILWSIMSNVGWFCTILGIAGVIYGIKRFADAAKI